MMINESGKDKRIAELEREIDEFRDRHRSRELALSEALERAETAEAELAEVRRLGRQQVDRLVERVEGLKADNAKLREALRDVLDGYFDMSPLEYAKSRGLESMSDAEGEAILGRARKAALGEGGE